MSPIDYSALLTKPDFQPLMRGLQIRRENQQADAQEEYQQQRIGIAQQEIDAKAAKDAAWQTDIGSVMANPTTVGFQQLFLKHPEQAGAIKQASDAQTEAQKTRNVQAAMRLGGFLNAGLPDQAVKDLEQRRAALAEAGESTEITDAAISAIKAGDMTKAKALAGMVIAGTLGEDAGDVLDTLGYSEKARRDREKDDRDEKRLDLTERRVLNSERATSAAIAGRSRDDARADRKAAGGGKGGGKKGGAYSDAQLDALLQ
jgi:hypothetical protein